MECLSDVVGAWFLEQYRQLQYVDDWVIASVEDYEQQDLNGPLFEGNWLYVVVPSRVECRERVLVGEECAGG
jgi:hypothetical protein